MAKISGLPPATTIIGSDIVAGVESSITKKIKAEDILMVKSLDAVRWKSFRISPSKIKLAGIKDPDFTKFKDNGAGSTGVYLYWYDSIIEEEMFFDMQAPCQWKEDSPIYVQFYWVPKTGGAGEKVCWGIEVTTINVGEVFGNTSIYYTCTHLPDGDLIASKLYYSEIEVMTTGLTISNCDVVRVFRDATGTGGTDNYTDDAGLVSIAIKYQSDAIGSATKNVK